MSPDVIPSGGEQEFGRGLIYTVDPRVLAPLTLDEQYRIVASSRVRISKEQSFSGYESLYRRARRLVATRRPELTCAGGAAHVHTWIVSHGWFRMDVSSFAIVGAVVTLGVRCAEAGMDLPRGEDEPTPDALTMPYVEQLGPKPGAGKPWFDEFYNDFDVRADARPTSAVTVSYGEYVATPDRIDVTALMARSEHLARVYVDAIGIGSTEVRIVRRDWRCLETGKSSKPFLAHVDLTLAPEPRTLEPRT